MMPMDDRSLPDLELEVEVELREAEASGAAGVPDTNPAEWLFDPTDVERDEVGLRNILGAAWALDERSGPT